MKESEWTIKTAEDDYGEHTLILLNGSVEATLDGIGWITPEETASLRQQLVAAQSELEAANEIIASYEQTTPQELIAEQHKRIKELQTRLDETVTWNEDLQAKITELEANSHRQSEQIRMLLRVTEIADNANLDVLQNFVGLQAENARLKAALKPFAEDFNYYLSTTTNPSPNGYTEWHREWSFTDASHYEAAYLILRDHASETEPTGEGDYSNIPMSGEKRTLVGVISHIRTMVNRNKDVMAIMMLDSVNEDIVVFPRTYEAHKHILQRGLQVRLECEADLSKGVLQYILGNMVEYTQANPTNDDEN